MKKIIFSLFVSIIGLINFSSASFTVATQGNIISYNTENISQLYNTYGYGFLCLNSVPSDTSIMIYDTNWAPLNTIQAQQIIQDFCFFIDGSASNIQVYTNNASSIQYDYIIAGQSSCPSENEICPNIKLNIVDINDNIQGTGLYLTNYASQNVGFSNIYYSGNLQFSQSNGNLLMTCPSADCSYIENEFDILQDEYNLLYDDYDNLQSSYNSLSGSLSSCESELNICTPALSSCLSGGSSDLSGTNWSALFINDIQHIGNSIIDITIPEEISWDYLNTGDIFEIDIEGYNVDTEYIDNIIRTQNYKPTSEDFTELVKMLAPYSKIIIFCVFLFIVWAWIKKPFKSKKL